MISPTTVTCVVWAGFDQSETIYPGAFSSETVLPVWTTAMNEAAKLFAPKAFVPPPDSEQVEICLKSGELASDDCYEMLEKGDGITSQVRCTYQEYLRPGGTNLEMICHIHGKGGSNLRNLTNAARKGPLVAQYVVQESVSPVLPVAPTIIGTNDPYNSLAPVIRARVAAVVAEVVEPGAELETSTEEVGNNGIPVARPVIVETEEEELPAQRVTLPPPRAIEIE